MKNRQLSWPRGKVLGGSSSINGLLWVRGQPQDYDSWGSPKWSWDSVLPLFKKLENHHIIDERYHGTTGPIVVSRVN